MSKFRSNLNLIVLIIFILAGLFFIRYIIITTNIYQYPESKNCVGLDDYLHQATYYTLSGNFIHYWHNDVKIKSLDLDIKKKCPSFNKDSQLIVGGNLLASTAENFDSKNFTVNDCHEKTLYIINTEIEGKHEEFEKYHKLSAEILGPDGQDFYAFIANVDILDKSFDIYDINKNYVAKISKHFYSTSWKVEILNQQHMASDPRLIMLIIGKMSSGILYDFCNTTIGGITTLLIFSIVIGPFFILYLAYTMYCEKPIRKSGRIESGLVPKLNLVESLISNN